MAKKMNVPEPVDGLKFIDVHCHLPFPRPKNDRLPSDKDQYDDYFRQGGLYLITSTIDMETLNLTLEFMKDFSKNFGFCCAWAPQTEKYLAIGEIGLDFHHAKTLEKRNKQIEEFRKILELTKDLGKRYVLHVRNAAKHEFDRQNPKHRFNNIDGANKEILRILKEFNIVPRNVMWHCFSGPQEYGFSLPKRGFTLSVPSSAYGQSRWLNVTRNSPLDSLVTETDSYYQHPYKRGPVNVPSNVKYSIAALAYSHRVSQQEVSERTAKNATQFFNLEIE
jgi:Tat protein secretion system quality control protein TatD with DNase activity